MSIFCQNSSYCSSFIRVVTLSKSQCIVRLIKLLVTHSKIGHSQSESISEINDNSSSPARKVSRNCSSILVISICCFSLIISSCSSSTTALCWSSIFIIHAVAASWSCVLVWFIWFIWLLNCNGCNQDIPICSNSCSPLRQHSSGLQSFKLSTEFHSSYCFHASSDLEPSTGFQSSTGFHASLSCSGVLGPIVEWYPSANMRLQKPRYRSLSRLCNSSDVGDWAFSIKSSMCWGSSWSLDNVSLKATGDGLRHLNLLHPYSWTSKLSISVISVLVSSPSIDTVSASESLSFSVWQWSSIASTRPDSRVPMRLSGEVELASIVKSDDDSGDWLEGSSWEVENVGGWCEEGGECRGCEEGEGCVSLEMEESSTSGVISCKSSGWLEQRDCRDENNKIINIETKSMKQENKSMDQDLPGANRDTVCLRGYNLFLPFDQCLRPPQDIKHLIGVLAIEQLRLMAKDENHVEIRISSV